MKIQTGKPTTPQKEEQAVKLPPLLGVSPGCYLTIFCGLFLLFLFSFLFFPGLWRPGQYLWLSSLPERASLYVDDKHVGATPHHLFLTAGTHKITLRKPFFSSEEFSLQVPRALFPWQRREKLLLHPKLLDLEGLLINRHREYSSLWLTTTGGHPTYFAPPLLSETVEEVLEGKENLSREEYLQVEHFLLSALQSTISEELWKDLQKAWGLLYETEKPVNLANPESIPDSLRSLPLFPKILELYEAFGSQGSLLSQPASSFSPPKNDDSLHQKRFQQARKSPLQFDSLTFLHYPAGRFTQGEGHAFDSPSVEQEISGFFLAQTLTTNREFRRFLAENPKWDLSNLAFLEERQLVADAYLKAFKNDSPEEPLRFISWFAAKAYTEWLSATYGGHFRLPTEKEWEYAAQMDKSLPFAGESLEEARELSQGTSGLRGLLGALWQWNQNWYAPLGYHFSSDSQPLPRVRKSARGFSWINAREEVSLFSRGALPPITTSPYVGLRVLREEFSAG